MDSISQPIGHFQNFIFSEEETLLLKEKIASLSGDSFDIRTSNGQHRFQVKGHTFSLSGRKRVTDSQGIKLFDIRKKFLTFRRTYYCTDSQGVKFLNVERRFKLIGLKAIATFTSPSRIVEEFKMEESLLHLGAKITLERTQTELASIKRKLLEPRDLLFNKQGYRLIVEPNVDQALMVAMCICMGMLP
ncbi:uncharacterized protein BDZ99DRAFT_381248 [Mytilinidion resinicola]|uniref:DUF567-domain-containing protein n=1 Tax=Mytilinidion resinicola TaxID=574789 RepID=A0A6A6YXU9_9PEZI|nr:uncharacterized protein BDZ99DRAFT_381248 [Mytilinidion resinicola]KAF2812824.1 hypothetical protein BDZ99DRAFT_381248 [Mytilinidion resinicola]